MSTVKATLAGLLVLASLFGLMLSAAAAGSVTSGTIIHQVQPITTHPAGDAALRIDWQVAFSTETGRGDAPIVSAVYATVTRPDGSTFSVADTAVANNKAYLFVITDQPGIWSLHIDAVIVSNGTYTGGDHDDSVLVGSP